MHPATAEQDFMLAQDFKDRAKQKPIIYPHPHIVRVRCRVLLPTAAARDSDAAPGMGAVAGTHTGPPQGETNIWGGEKRRRGYRLPPASPIGKHQANDKQRFYFPQWKPTRLTRPNASAQIMIPITETTAPPYDA